MDWRGGRERREREGGREREVEREGGRGLRGRDTHTHSRQTCMVLVRTSSSCSSSILRGSR